MLGFVRQGTVLVGAVVMATPAAAAPQLTGGNLDYFLMPFLGYCGIIAIAHLFAGRVRRSTTKP